MRRKQQGVALITAMMVVAIAALVATNLVWEQQLQMRRSASLLAFEQGRMYALAAENLATTLVNEDREEVSEVDHLSEYWAGDEYGNQAPLELDQGSLRGSIIDLQGRFNINNLFRNGQADQISMSQFKRLLRVLELDESTADAVLDWIDPDQDVCCARGAEDDLYTGKTPPYRAANRYLTSTSELLAIEGVDEELYRSLEPYIAALPPGWCGTDDITHINVNTAPDKVLLALDENVTQGNVDQWLSERIDLDGYRDLSAFERIVSEEVLGGNYLGLNTECFAARVSVNIGTFRMSMYSLLDRQGQVDNVVTRVRYFGIF